MKYNIGVSIGTRFIQAGIVDKYGRLIARTKMDSHSERAIEDIVADAAKLINTLLDNQDLDIRDAKSIGVACPGLLDEEGSKIIKTHIMGFNKAPIRDEFKVYFNNLLHIENDAHCIALAESVAGAAEDLDYSVTIHIGNGISGGIIINNKLYTGFNGAGAVLGHTVIDKNGKDCSCGRRGCFETLCSEKALIEQTREAALDNPDSLIMQICENDLTRVTGTTAYEAMKLGDTDAKRIFDEYVENMAIALTNISNILMPEVIILSGGITVLGEGLLKPVREKMYNWVYSREYTLPMLKLSEMGSASVLIGAGMLGTYKK
ncbi:MAG TPA: ROK family protein [Anaerovoracaceae bacterium]|nr:ROK family protein [Anaerovoracaceae bacterium]